MPGELAKQLDARIRSLTGVQGKRSKWASGNAYYVGPREFAHFHDEKEIDVRLTKKVQKEHSRSLRNDVRVTFRERPSEWITLRLQRSGDVAFAFEMVKLALHANRAAFANEGPKK